MMSAMGAGAIVGGLYSAGSQFHSARSNLILSAFFFGISILIASIMSTIGFEMAAMFIVGALSVLFISLGNTTLQLTSKNLRCVGRVMSFWAIAFQGTTPIGGPIIGFIGDHTNPRIGFVVSAVPQLLSRPLPVM